MKDYYTLKEIIFGLRKEQLRIVDKLRLLESKIRICEDVNYEYSRLNFDIVNNNEIVYQLEQKYSFLENIINLLTFKFTQLFSSRCYNEHLRKLKNGNYVIGGMGGMFVTIPQDEQASFAQIFEELINDEFISSGSLEVRGNMRYRYENSIVLCPTVTSCLDFSGKYFNNLFYFARDDIFSIMQDSLGRHDYGEIIKELMELRFPRRNFSEYVQHIIDSNDDTKKDLVIPPTTFYTKSAEFYLKDERDAFVLVKK